MYVLTDLMAIQRALIEKRISKPVELELPRSQLVYPAVLLRCLLFRGDALLVFVRFIRHFDRLICR
uniref:Uncharacterized protein n=1 Tax=Anguilla anguilla TaxID=7936 RepID=A0A0E9VYJ5_ANGAN